MQFLTELLGKESARRRECRRRSRIRSAGFPQMKYLHELVMEDMPKEAQVILPELETLDFIRQGRNLVLYGNPGTGKTHIATALGIKACQQDFTVLFTSVPVSKITVLSAILKKKIFSQACWEIRKNII
jgi:DNA replication protein DnaC